MTDSTQPPADLRHVVVIRGDDIADLPTRKVKVTVGDADAISARICELGEAARRMPASEKEDLIAVFGRPGKEAFLLRQDIPIGEVPGLMKKIDEASR